MIVKIKEDNFKKIIKMINDGVIYFDTDGCACGELVIKLDDNLHISIYRSCRSSNGIPDGKLWHIEDFKFYQRSYDDSMCYNISQNTQLDPIQKKILLMALKAVSKYTWGNEFTDEY